MNYNPYQVYQQPMMPMQTPQSIQPQTVQPQIQNGGLVSVRNISEARNYPVAPGNSVTFKDENSPYVYTKTMGFSQLDRPIFEVFRLVKEEVAQEIDTKPDLKQEIDNLKADVEKLKKMVEKGDEVDD